MELSTIEIMLICSIFVSSDIIAAMSILKFDEQPHIFVMIIGEGLFNDVVVLVLYATCQEYFELELHEKDKSMTWSKAWQIFGSFISLCVISVLFGMFTGFLLTWLLKKLRYISHSAI